MACLGRDPSLPTVPSDTLTVSQAWSLAIPMIGMFGEFHQPPALEAMCAQPGMLRQ
jgi:hypothetical protein